MDIIKYLKKNIILKSGCYESPPGYKKAEWFADEVIKKGKKGFFTLKTLIKIL